MLIIVDKFKRSIGVKSCLWSKVSYFGVKWQNVSTLRKELNEYNVISDF